MRLPIAMVRGVLAVLALLAVPEPATASSEAVLQRQSFLAEELAAAGSKKFYLMFDPVAPALDLKIEGVRVHRFVLDKAEFGQSRLAGSGPRQWPAAAFALVSELPEPDRPRLEVQQADEAEKARDASIKRALAAGQQPAGELSQTAGEKVARLYQTEDRSAPMTFRLQFEPDLVLVVRGEPRATDLGSRLRRVGYALQDGWHGVRLWLGGETLATRVVVYLPPEDARRLFRVLAPEIRLLVQSPPTA